MVIDSGVADGTTVSGIKSSVERIRALEAERRNLLLEIEELKKMADAKANALESEINMLRDEVKELRVLLGGEEDAAGSSGKKRK
jgi:seryl-tRNA synthetase